ncbi:MAG: hypothetical protein IPN13_18840 [Bacteroidetes bacterium]|nr:hypothetical protein [Bacteroidota bacterium]
MKPHKQDFTRRRSQRTFTLGFTYRFGELKDGGRTRNRDTQPREEMDMGFLTGDSTTNLLSAIRNRIPFLNVFKVSHV